MAYQNTDNSLCVLGGLAAGFDLSDIAVDDSAFSSGSDTNLSTTATDKEFAAILNDPSFMIKEDKNRNIFGQDFNLEDALWKKGNEQVKNSAVGQFLNSIGKQIGIPNLPEGIMTTARDALKSSRDMQLQQNIKAIEQQKLAKLRAAANLQAKEQSARYASEKKVLQAQLLQLANQIKRDRMAQKALQDRKTSTINKKASNTELIKKAGIGAALLGAGGGVAYLLLR